MKVIYFALFGLVLSFTEVSAQDRGREGRRESESRSDLRFKENKQDRRGNNDRRDLGARNGDNRNRFVDRKNNDRFGRDNQNWKTEKRKEPIYNNRIENTRHQQVFNQRKAPVRIQNRGNNYSYGRPVNNFDVRGYHQYHYNKSNFYGKNGVYYRPYNNGFVRFMPPIGFNINILPVGAITINIGARPYYFYEGVFYQRNNRNYQVIEPPLGAYVYALPSGYERVEHRGQLYYEYAGVLYEKVYHRGENAYQVVGYLS